MVSAHNFLSYHYCKRVAIKIVHMTHSMDDFIASPIAEWPGLEVPYIHETRPLHTHTAVDKEASQQDLQGRHFAFEKTDSFTRVSSCPAGAAVLQLRWARG